MNRKTMLKRDGNILTSLCINSWNNRRNWHGC